MPLTVHVFVGPFGTKQALSQYSAGIATAPTVKRKPVVDT
jgi:hypothetical protein